MEDAAAVDTAAELHEGGDRSDRERDGDDGLPPCGRAHRDAVGHGEGAVAGKNDTTFAQAVSGLPIAAKETKYPAMSTTLTGPAALCASSGRDASAPSAPNTVA